MTNFDLSAEKILGRTESVCPFCLKKIPAQRLQRGADIYLQKECPVHGEFTTIIWRGKPDFLSWYKIRSAQPPQNPLTETKKGCPYDCGPCPEHRQQTCCVLIEVTERCNLRCPVCFADAGKHTEDPLVTEIKEQLEVLKETAGLCNIQFSGGEPTVRDDLPAIIRTARSLEFTFIQLNTNGLRLAQDKDYVRALKEAGLSTVFLQFDGTRDEIYRKLRGADLLALKKKAIENCIRFKLGVVLVPTLVPGINTDNIGSIISFALEGLPGIRGVHFQPVSYFGRYPAPPKDEDRITLPEVLTAIETQTQGKMRIENFSPVGCEHTLCSFHGDFIFEEDNNLTPLTRKETCCTPRIEDAALKKQSFVRQRWAVPEKTGSCCDKSNLVLTDLDLMIHRLQNQRLSISGMAFQDVANLDLERLKDCCLNVLKEGRRIPFCAFNLSSWQGHSLYRK